MNKLKLRAYGKVNLGLDVVRKREDGYHEVSMIMQTVRLYDHLEFMVTDTDGIEITTNWKYLPVDESNLVYKAIAMLKEEFAISKGVKVHLDKHIPVAAGMAGGSSDCAAALFAMNRLFQLGLSEKELMQRGVRLGADVPYCIMRGTALSEGIGEVLTPLPPMPDCYILIAKPPISVSTKYVYEHLKLDELDHHPDIAGMVEGLKQQDLFMITDRMENVLETVTVLEYPEISQIKEMMMESGAVNALMSGSGPTVFGIFMDKETADKANKLIFQSKIAKQVYTVTPYNTRRQ